MIEHYIQKLYPGILFSETINKPIDHRNYKNIVKEDRCYGFRFYDVEKTISEDGRELTSEPFNFSCFHYYGKKYSLDEVIEKFPNEKTLIANMKINQYDSVVQTLNGNFYELNEKDVVL